MFYSRYPRDTVSGGNADEVADVDPNLAIRDGKDQVDSVRYMAVNAMLLNEFLKEQGVSQRTEQSAGIGGGA
jgi:hypothetical protein